MYGLNVWDNEWLKSFFIFEQLDFDQEMIKWMVI